MPVDEIIPYAERRLFHAPEPLVKDRKGVRHKQKCYGLILGKDTMDAVIDALSLFVIERPSAFQKQPVNIIVPLRDKIELPLFCF